MNRRFIGMLVLLSLLVGKQTDGHAQANETMLKEGKVWNCRLVDWSVYYGSDDDLTVDDVTHYYSYRIKGETEVRGVKYYNVYREEGGVSKLDQLWREEGRRVYQLYGYGTSYEEERLMYDFGLDVGETVTVNGGFTMSVTNVDLVKVSSGSFRRFTVRGDGSPLYWIESVGAPMGIDYPCGQLFNDGRERKLLSCYEDGACIFTQDDFNASAFTDGIAGASTIGQVPASSCCFDLQGRRLNSQPRRGIYVKDGKKFVAK